MVSKARLDFPDPDSPVNTISASRGRSSEMFCRLCSRAPRTTRRSATEHIVCASTDTSHLKWDVIEASRERWSGITVWGMTAAASPATTQLETLRGLVRTATQRLLGDTILVTDEQWRAPSRLPAWTRGHVATHIARHADALVRLTQWARSGERQDMYPSPEYRANEIEAGAGRSGLDLQIDLDSPAGGLKSAFEELDAADAWDAMVEMRGGIKVPARLLPLARLLEVVIHHVDLDIGYEITDIDAQTGGGVVGGGGFPFLGWG